VLLLHVCCLQKRNRQRFCCAQTAIYCPIDLSQTLKPGKVSLFTADVLYLLARVRNQESCSNKTAVTGTPFDYHGACDLVLIKSSLVNLHARTEERIETGGRWSAVTKVAIQIKATDRRLPTFNDTVESQLSQSLDETVEFQVIEGLGLLASWRDEKLFPGLDSDLLRLLKPFGFDFVIFNLNFTLSLANLFYFELTIVEGDLQVGAIAERSLLPDAVGLYGEQLISCSMTELIACILIHAPPQSCTRYCSSRTRIL